MQQDPLYFPRRNLAEIILKSLADGITHAFTLFAPRRMGKTQFLLRDIVPLAENTGFNVFYFSFMDDQPETVITRFQAALCRFAADTSKVKTFITSIKKVNIAGSGIERETHNATLSISDIIGHLANDKRQTLLLLDEAQELARIKGTDGLIRALRTGLDVNQSRIKTIFTGSSTNGLRAMFNDSKAPFFHFAHSLDFPLLGQEFTDFLADVYQQRTQQVLDRAALYHAFERMNKTPLYMRAMIQDMIINPAMTTEQAAHIRMEQMQENSDFPRQWNALSALERLILQHIAHGRTKPYSADTRQQMAAKMGIGELATSTVQGNIHKLERKEMLTRNSGHALQINSPLLKTWIIENTGNDA